MQEAQQTNARELEGMTLTLQQVREQNSTDEQAMRELDKKVEGIEFQQDL